MNKILRNIESSKKLLSNENASNNNLLNKHKSSLNNEEITFPTTRNSKSIQRDFSG